MADVLYELEYSVNTSALDKAEARLKRFEAAMERSSATASKLQSALSGMGSGGVLRSSSAGGPGVVRSSGGGRGLFGKSDFEALARAAQKQEEKLAGMQWRNIAKAEAARVRAERQVAREATRSGKEQERQQRAIFRERDRHVRSWQRDEDRAQRARDRSDAANRRVIDRWKNKAYQRDIRHLTDVRDANTRMLDQLKGAGLGLGAGLLGAGALAIGGLMSFGDRAVQVMGERDTSLRNYTALMGGDRERAGLEYYRAQQFARKTDFTESSVTKAQSSLIAQGFRGDELYRTLFAAADLSSLSDEDKSEALKGVVRALGQIKAKGRLQAEEMNQIAEHAPLGRDRWFEEIQRGLGLKDRKAVEALMQKGGVSADVGISAFQRATLGQLGTEKLGQFSTQSAGSITSLLSNLQEAQSMLAKSFDSDTLPAMARFRESLTQLSSQFDVSTKAGQNLAFVYKDVANTAVEAKAAFAGFKSEFFRSFADSYRRERERQIANGNLGWQTPEGYLGAKAARNKDAVEQFGKTLGGSGSLAAKAMDSDVAYNALKMTTGVLRFYGDVVSGRNPFSERARTEMLPGAASDDGYGLQNWVPRSLSRQEEAYKPPTMTELSKAKVYEKSVGLTIPTVKMPTRSQRARVASSGHSSAGSGGGGSSGGSGDDHSVRIGTQVTVQQMTLQVTVPAQPGMTPQAMSTMIGESVREALVREVGRGARRPRV